MAQLAARLSFQFQTCYRTDLGSIPGIGTVCGCYVGASPQQSDIAAYSISSILCSPGPTQPSILNWSVNEY